jgi:hypothetical protein
LTGGGPSQRLVREVESEIGKDNHLLLLWYVREGAPRWNIEETGNRTALVSQGRESAAVRPVRVAGGDPYIPLPAIKDGWSFNSALLVFPAARPDGSPVLQTGDDQIEVRTELDDRPVILRFDLTRSGLSSIDQLRRR